MRIPILFLFSFVLLSPIRLNAYFNLKTYLPVTYLLVVLFVVQALEIRETRVAVAVDAARGEERTVWAGVGEVLTDASGERCRASVPLDVVAVGLRIQLVAEQAHDHVAVDVAAPGESSGQLAQLVGSQGVGVSPQPEDEAEGVAIFVGDTVDDHVEAVATNQPRLATGDHVRAVDKWHAGIVLHLVDEVLDVVDGHRGNGNRQVVGLHVVVALKIVVLVDRHLAVAEDLDVEARALVSPGQVVVNSCGRVAGDDANAQEVDIVNDQRLAHGVGKGSHDRKRGCLGVICSSKFT